MKSFYFALFFFISSITTAQYDLKRKVTLTGNRSSNPAYLVEYNNNLFFSASNLFPPARNTQVELHKLVNKNASPIPVLNLDNSGSARVSHNFTLGGNLFFSASNFTGINPQLYRYEGENVEPTRLTIFSTMGTNFGGSGAVTSQFVIKPNYFIFKGFDDVTNSSNLFKYDDSNKNIQKLVTLPEMHFINKIISNGDEFLGISNDNITYFKINDKSAGNDRDELWILNNINFDIKYTGLNYSSITNAYIYNDELYYNASDNDGKRQLYKYNYKTETETKITNNALADGTNPIKFKSLNNVLLFSGSNGNSFYEQLIKYENGTIELVKNLYIESEFFKKDNKIYFYGRDSDYIESGIWESDGSEEGTKLILPNNDNRNISGFKNATLFENEIYFLSDTEELWVTSFEANNTKKLTSFNDDALPNLASTFSGFTNFDGQLWFAGLDNEEGQELWSVKKTGNLSTFTESKFQLKIAPNPTSDFVYLRNIINPNVTISLFDVRGKELYLEKIYNKKEHMLDISSFSKGIYILSIVTETSRKTIKLIKD